MKAKNAAEVNKVFRRLMELAGEALGGIIKSINANLVENTAFLSLLKCYLGAIENR